MMKAKLMVARLERKEKHGRFAARVEGAQIGTSRLMIHRGTDSIQGCHQSMRASHAVLFSACYDNHPVFSTGSLGNDRTHPFVQYAVVENEQQHCQTPAMRVVQSLLKLGERNLATVVQNRNLALTIWTCCFQDAVLMRSQEDLVRRHRRLPVARHATTQAGTCYEVGNSEATRVVAFGDCCKAEEEVEEEEEAVVDLGLLMT